MLARRRIESPLHARLSTHSVTCHAAAGNALATFRSPNTITLRSKSAPYIFDRHYRSFGNGETLPQGALDRGRGGRCAQPCHMIAGVACAFSRKHSVLEVVAYVS